MPRKRVPVATETRVLTSCRRRCCVCYGLNRDASVKQGQIAHLDRNPENNHNDNLVFLCFDHHDRYDSRTSQSKNFTADELKQYREELFGHLSTMPEDPSDESADAFNHAAGEKFVVPGDVRAGIAILAPEFRVPGVQDFAAEWAAQFDANIGFPVLCQGSFTGRAQVECGIFILGIREVRYKIVVFTETTLGKPQLIELESDRGQPHGRYIKTVQPGTYSISRAVWKHGGAKTLQLSRQGVMVGTFESAACIYHWDDRTEAFKHQWISD